MPGLLDQLSQLLFGRQTITPGDPAPPPAPTPVVPTPDAAGVGGAPTPVNRKLLILTHNPIMPDGQRIQTAYKWQEPDGLVQRYIDDLRTVSWGYLNHTIVENRVIDGFPVKKDGFAYTPESFAAAWKARQFHQPDAVDYLALVRDFQLNERVDSGEIDEVWLMGFPYCGYYESHMAGPGAFWCNSPALAGTERCKRRYVIMGFNYERGVGEMLENYGHRAESILREVYRNHKGEANLWERFIRHEKTHPGQAECGNVHFAPNSVKDYDWGNPTPVQSRADTWLKFPDLSGPARTMTCADWGGGDIREHHKWWFTRFPHLDGEIDGVAANWWRYVVDPNQVG